VSEAIDTLNKEIAKMEAEVAEAEETYSKFGKEMRAKKRQLAEKRVELLKAYQHHSRSTPAKK
jgi:hypothetical protein